jgi:hypothetical protein
LVGDLTPLLRTIFPDKPDKLLIFSLDPVTFLDGRFLILIELILTLRVVSAWNEMGNLNPVILVQLLWRDALAPAILCDSPLKQFGFVICPVFLGVVRLFALLLIQPVENL